MRYLVHQTIIAEELNKLPIFVTLRDWNPQSDSQSVKPEISLQNFITNQFAICNFPGAAPFIEYILESGIAIVLFDGLDEVPEADDQRKAATTALQEFCRKYLNAQVIITCRVAATDYSFTEFTYIEMADFNEKQVEIYSRKWFSKEHELADRFLTDLKKTENKGVRDLGHSPLLLSMICLAYKETLKIPKRRVEMYEEALDSLLQTWDASRIIQRDEFYKNLSIGRKRQMFSRIAVDAFEKGKIFFTSRELSQSIEQYMKNLPPDDTEHSVDGEKVLQSIAAQHGILVERAKKIYAFAHLTFQEYYTAKYIVDNPHLISYSNFAKHLPEHRWREVFLMTASMLNEADRLMDSMLLFTDQLLDNYPALREIQEWVERKSRDSSIENAGAVKSLNWYLALDISHFQTRNWISSLEFAHALENIRDFSYKIANNQNFLPIALLKAQNLVDFNGLALDYYRELTGELRDLTVYFEEIEKHTSVLEKTILLDIALLLALSICYMFSLESRFTEIQAHYKEVSEFFEKIRLFSKDISPSLAKVLNSLKIPYQHSTTFEWETFEKKLRAITTQHHDIGHNWSLSDEDLSELRKYLVANSVILDSLQIAYLENRKILLERLYRKTTL